MYGEFELVFRGEVLSGEVSLMEAGIDDDCRVAVRLKVLSPGLVPPREGYETQPNFETLKQMRDPLRQIHNFKIWNEHGQIVFLEPVDLRDADLSQVQIFQRQIDVF
jgi:hypothetical protein